MQEAKSQASNCVDLSPTRSPKDQNYSPATLPTPGIASLNTKPSLVISLKIYLHLTKGNYISRKVTRGKKGKLDF